MYTCIHIYIYIYVLDAANERPFVALYGSFAGIYDSYDFLAAIQGLFAWMYGSFTGVYGSFA